MSKEGVCRQMGKALGSAAKTRWAARTEPAGLWAAMFARRRIRWKRDAMHTAGRSQLLFVVCAHICHLQQHLQRIHGRSDG